MAKLSQICAIDENPADSPHSLKDEKHAFIRIKVRRSMKSPAKSCGSDESAKKIAPFCRESRSRRRGKSDIRPTFQVDRFIFPRPTKGNAMGQDHPPKPQ